MIHPAHGECFVIGLYRGGGVSSVGLNRKMIGQFVPYCNPTMARTARLGELLGPEFAPTIGKWLACRFPIPGANLGDAPTGNLDRLLE